MPAVLVPIQEIHEVKANELIQFVEELMESGSARAIIIYDGNTPILEIPLRASGQIGRLINPLTLARTLTLVTSEFTVEVVRQVPSEGT
jgi:hypothetical protein